MSLMNIHEDIMRECGLPVTCVHYQVLSDLSKKVEQAVVEHFAFRGEALQEIILDKPNPLLDLKYSLIVFIDTIDYSKVLLHLEARFATTIKNFLDSAIVNYNVPSSYKSVILPLGYIDLVFVNLANHRGEPTCDLMKVIPEIRKGPDPEKREREREIYKF